MGTFNILFDQWGTQVQVQQTMGEQRLNTLFGALESAGASSSVVWKSAISTDPITSEQLEGINVLAILTRAAIDGKKDSSTYAYSNDEITAITNFVGAGNGLLLISNHPNFGVNDALLAESFGITIDTTSFISMPISLMTGGEHTRPMMVMSGFDLNKCDPKLSGLFLGVDSLSTHDACGISSSASGATWLATFPSGAVFQPINGRGEIILPSAVEYFGMFVPYQSGKVIALGNSGICGDNGGTQQPACGTISYGSNLMFLLNCFRFLGNQPQASSAGNCPSAA